MAEKIISLKFNKKGPKTWGLFYMLTIIEFMRKYTYR